MLTTYQNANRSERNAVIRQIDSFLEILSQDAKIFWLKFRRKLKGLNEQNFWDFLLMSKFMSKPKIKGINFDAFESVSC